MTLPDMKFSFFVPSLTPTPSAANAEFYALKLVVG